jgi:hypothetical protein
MDGMVLFSTSPESVTARNLARSPEAVVHLESGDEVAILEGPIEPWGGDPKLRREFADRYEAKYDHRPEDDDPGTPVFALCPRKALSWTEQEFPSSATRWTF